jgi:uncharacterized protein YxjI
MQQIKTSKMFNNRNLYFVKEQVGFLKFNGQYDIFDPGTQEQIGSAKEDPGALMHVLRFIIAKTVLPTEIKVDDLTTGMQAMRLEKGFGLFSSTVKVFDKDDNYAGCFKSKVFSWSGGFQVFDATDTRVAEVKGKFASWDYRFVDLNGTEMGMVSKKWSGLGKELFTSADNYMIQINDQAGINKDEYGMLLLGVCLALDVIYREKK